MNEMICIFGCEKDEEQLFTKFAENYGILIRCIADPLKRENIRHIPLGSAVSVNHKTAVHKDLIRMLEQREVNFLSSRSAGLDHIDLSEAERAGICVKNVAYSPESVAEHAIMLMLMALRNAGSILRRVDNQDFRLEERRATELRDMTVGVIGTGRIGKSVIDLLRGFGCPILAYDPNPSLNVRYVALNELLRQSDLVTLHLPLTASTRHLLNRDRIAHMRRGAMLVNTARGALVDAVALADALEIGDIACAALDVVEGEEGWFYRDCSTLPPPPFARLLTLTNAIVTPHTGFYTEHALRDIVNNTIRDFLEYRGGLRWVG